MKFNQAFIEQRMAEHKLWQHAAEYALIEEIIDEVQELPKRRPRSGRLFELLPEHVQASIVTDLEPRQ
jgi:hypothetical protein